MKFDVVIGNPPYGKCSHMALKMLNISSKLSNNIWFVLPRTFRKKSIQKRIDTEIMLKTDITIATDAFPIFIYTCIQNWVKSKTRRLITTKKETNHFYFTEKALCNIAIRRVGVNAGRLTDISKACTNTHYFIRTKPTITKEIIERLNSIDWNSVSTNTVSVKSITRDEIITLYENKLKA